LWDNHQHFSDNDGTLDLANGVTSARDMANDTDTFLQRVARFDNGTELGPRVLKAGIIDGTGELAGPTKMRADTAEEAIKDVETQANAARLTLNNAISGGPADLPYWGDQDRVRQILVNLLTNAIKFTEAGGRITLSGGTGEPVTGAGLAGSGPWIYVRVEDTGRGIAADRLDAIFEPFQQSEQSDRDHGTGLGLSISRQLARMMGGDLVAESEVGTGSRFTLWLPIAPAEPVPR
jgi:signal transduction histidine kinase